MKLVSKSEGAVNVTSPLIDSEYLGKFVMPGMNMKCSLIQTEKSIQLTIMNYASNL